MHKIMVLVFRIFRIRNVEFVHINVYRQVLEWK